MDALVGRLKLKGTGRVIFILASLLVLFSTTGCLDEGAGAEGETEVVGNPSEVLPPLTTPERTVCDPFDAGVSARDRGLVGYLLYLEDDQPRYSSAREVINNGTPIQSTLYFDKLHVPTRAFDLGFYTQDGVLITNQNDQAIYEYFGLYLESKVILGQADEAGWYQFAVLSDDGAILSEKSDENTLSEIVNNDGNHPTKMKCASQAVYMDENTRKNIVLEYHQGPRYHIAVTLMWRKLAEGENPNNPALDSECNKSGNSRYFDSTQVPSEPTTVWYEMLTRGWKVLNNENYYFPEQASNPCAEEDPLLITNVSIFGVTRNQITMTWTTSIPSTSQAEVKNIGSDVVIQSPIDSNPKTNHSVVVTGLSANTLYSIKAVSVTDPGQRAESEEKAFRTAR